MNGKSFANEISEKWSEDVYLIWSCKSTLLITTNLYVFNKINSRMLDSFLFESTLCGYANRIPKIQFIALKISKRKSTRRHEWKNGRRELLARFIVFTGDSCNCLLLLQSSTVYVVWMYSRLTELNLKIEPKIQRNTILTNESHRNKVE